MLLAKNYVNRVAALAVAGAEKILNQQVDVKLAMPC